MARACPGCGEVVPAGTTFCPACGTYAAWDEGEPEEVAAESPRLPGERPPAPPPPPPSPRESPAQANAVVPDRVDCPDCGEPNPMARSLCRRCGASLHRRAPAPAPTSAPGRPRRSRRGLWAGVGLFVLAVLAGMAVVLLTDDPDSPVAAPSEPASSAPADTPAPAVPSPDPTVTDGSASPQPAEPPFFANTEPDTEDAVGTGELVAVEVARGDRFDQVAFRVSGPGVGWVVEYVEEPRQQGSGRPVTIEGESVLRVGLQSLEPPSGVGGDLVATDTVAVVDVMSSGWFEGVAEYFVGLDGPPRPFRMIPDDDGGALLQIDTTSAG